MIQSKMMTMEVLLKHRELFETYDSFYNKSGDWLRQQQILDKDGQIR